MYSCCSAFWLWNPSMLLHRVVTSSSPQLMVWPPQSIHSAVGGCGAFYVQYMAIRNAVALNILVFVCCWVSVHISVEQRLLCHRVGVCSSSVRAPCAPTRRVLRLQFSVNTCFCFHLSHSGVMEWCQLMLVSLTTGDVKLLFICLVTADFYSFMKCLLRSLPSSSAIFVLMVGILYTFFIKVPGWICSLQRSSPALWVTVLFSNGVFDEQQFLFSI